MLFLPCSLKKYMKSYLQNKYDHFLVSISKDRCKLCIKYQTTYGKLLDVFPFHNAWACEARVRVVTISIVYTYTAKYSNINQINLTYGLIGALIVSTEVTGYTSPYFRIPAKIIWDWFFRLYLSILPTHLWLASRFAEIKFKTGWFREVIIVSLWEKTIEGYKE